MKSTKAPNLYNHVSAALKASSWGNNNSISYFSSKNRLSTTFYFALHKILFKHSDTKIELILYFFLPSFDIGILESGRNLNLNPANPEVEFIIFKTPFDISLACFYSFIYFHFYLAGLWFAVFSLKFVPRSFRFCKFPDSRILSELLE